MSERYADHIEALRQAVFGGAGVTQPATRRAVGDRAAALSGARRAVGAAVPDAIAGFVDKVARRAYTVTDADVRALRQAGYSEDAIFEITASTAVSAALGRLERGVAALRGEGEV